MLLKEKFNFGRNIMNKFLLLIYVLSFCFLGCRLPENEINPVGEWIIEHEKDLSVQTFYEFDEYFKDIKAPVGFFYKLTNDPILINVQESEEDNTYTIESELFDINENVKLDLHYSQLITLDREERFISKSCIINKTKSVLIKFDLLFEEINLEMIEDFDFIDLDNSLGKTCEQYLRTVSQKMDTGDIRVNPNWYIMYSIGALNPTILPGLISFRYIVYYNGIKKHY
jgi:hypothetical protein